mmetsp:Transcript_126067/g.223269  ORF Transcript_126067/g.223269 Transcript_126067/m.223269 type:complete len:438 (-) Transcript_126067:6-1319(-)
MILSADKRELEGEEDEEAKFTFDTAWSSSAQAVTPSIVGCPDQQELEEEEEDVTSDTAPILGKQKPRSNNWQFVAIGFGLFLTSLAGVLVMKRLMPKRIEERPTTTITTTTTPFYYFTSDSARFARWSRRERHKSGFPKVLVYTWMTEALYTSLENEVYWKACYAHAHGFDVVFTDAGNRHSVEWYSDANMWAWLFAAQEYLTSGVYDYVIYMGGDVLINSLHLDFPLWAFDTGHYLTVMDQDADDWGLNENNLIFTVSSADAIAWVQNFIETMASHRKDHNLQGDNGPFMETLLTLLGHEVSAVGKVGYYNKCRSLLKMSISFPQFIKQSGFDAYTQANAAYSRCFFEELDRLIGPVHNRQSNEVGFVTTTDTAHFPWGNCWGHVRVFWKDWEYQCWAFHWNGGTGRETVHTLTGTCPDPTFNWTTSPYNRLNRRH